MRYCCDRIRAAADVLKHKNKIIAVGPWGSRNTKNAVDTIGKYQSPVAERKALETRRRNMPGARPQQCAGDRTMGIYEKPDETFLNQLKAVFGFEPPRQAGYDTVETIHAMHEGKAKVFFCHGRKFSFCFARYHVQRGSIAGRCRLTVHRLPRN